MCQECASIADASTSKTYRTIKMIVTKLVLRSTFTLLVSFSVRAEVPIFLDGFEDVPIEKAALIALYNSTVGDNWTDNTNWLAGDPCMDNWYGITCDGNSNISQITLSFNNLVGTIPPELGSLINLTDLYLNSNELTGNIPSELGNLSNLGDMSLRWNGLYTSDSTLDTFLDTKSGHDWSITQTVPPANVVMDSVTDQSVTLSWDVI